MWRASSHNPKDRFFARRLSIEPCRLNPYCREVAKVTWPPLRAGNPDALCWQLRRHADDRVPFSATASLKRDDPKLGTSPQKQIGRTQRLGDSKGILRSAFSKNDRDPVPGLTRPKSIAPTVLRAGASLAGNNSIGPVPPLTGLFLGGARVLSGQALQQN
jgi:hypothetical protein